VPVQHAVNRAIRDLTLRDSLDTKALKGLLHRQSLILKRLEAVESAIAEIREALLQRHNP
jgi:hypothetical protein